MSGMHYRFSHSQSSLFKGKLSILGETHKILFFIGLQGIGSVLISDITFRGRILEIELIFYSLVS